MKLPQVLPCLLALALALPSPALAAEKGEALFPQVQEYQGFTDVLDTDWFFPYTKLCYETGLLSGTGDGTFSPNGSVTKGQVSTLAARIHQVQNGGDGNLPQAPEDWGTVTLTLEDGTALTFGCGDYHRNPIPMGSVFALTLDEEQEAALKLAEEARVPATLTAVLADETYTTAGEISLDSAYRHLHFYAGDDQGSALLVKLGYIQRPEPGDWYRDTVYYWESVGLEQEYPYRPSDPSEAASRWDFVEALSLVVQPLLEPINQIDDYPDSSTDQKDTVLPFYNAGILTGMDEYGTFSADAGLTRAEMAAMAARLAEPALRVEFTPTPAPGAYTYTLTYLTEGTPNRLVTYPVCILDEPNENVGILTLAGDLLPFPGGQSPISLTPQGAYYHCTFWNEEGQEMGGLIDSTGTFAVPLTVGCYRARPIAGGGFLSQVGNIDGPCTLWDAQGQVVKELGDRDWYSLEETYPSPEVEPWNGVQPSGDKTCYQDQSRHPISQTFDWVSSLGADGAGFVGLDGGIYRIQFTSTSL